MNTSPIVVGGTKASTIEHEKKPSILSGMTAKLYERTEFVAAWVRAKIEEAARAGRFIKEDDLGRVYVDPINLGGACGLSSRVLQRILGGVGIRSRFVMGEYKKGRHEGLHCWVEIPKLGIIVDVTATQFGVQDPVSIVPDDASEYTAKHKGHKGVRKLDNSNWKGQSYNEFGFLNELVHDGTCVMRQRFQLETSSKPWVDCRTSWVQ